MLIKSIAKLLLCISSLSLLTGCTSVKTVPVNYSYNGNVDFIGMNHPEIRLQDIEDSRSDDNLKMYFYFADGFGNKSRNGIQAEKELSAILTDALKQGIRAAGLSTPSDRKIIISGTLTDVDSEVHSGMFSGTAIVQITAKLTAQDVATSKFIWRDTIQGDGEQAGAYGYEPYRIAFKNAITSLVNNMLSDPYFKQQVISSE